MDMNAFILDSELVTIQNGTLIFSESESINNENRLNITTKGFEIYSGSYKVDITYDSYINKNKIDENNADVSMSSRWNISFDTVTLDDQHNIVSGKLWIPFFTGCNDLKIIISYNGKGPLSISAITFTEALRYRIMRIIGFIGLFALCDFIMIAFFSYIRIPLKKTYAVLIGITIISSIPFFARVLWEGHDLWFHLLRIVSVAEELGNGQFPVRMATELNNGYGYPTSIYYCDLFLYPAAILYRQSIPLRICYQIYVVLINVITTFFIYLSLGKITENLSIKLLGTGMYVLCIYRLVNLNIRAAVGEYTSMAFLPLIMTGLYLIYIKDKPVFKDWIYLCVGMAGVLMSHVLTVEMVVVNILILCVILIQKTLKKERILAFIKAAVLCFGITAWFLIPFIDYFTSHVTIVQENDFRLLESNTQEFIYLFNLFSPGKNIEHYLTLGMPLILGLGIVLYCLSSYSKNEYKQGRTLRFISGFAFLNIIFVCKYFPWGRLQRHLGIEGLGYQIGTIQFPWRFLSIASVILVFAIVLALDRINQKEQKKFQIICFSLIVCIVLSVGFFYFKYTDEAGTKSFNMLQPYSDSDSLYLLDKTDRSLQNSIVPRVLQGEITIDDYSKYKDIFKMHVDNQNRNDAIVSIPIYNYKYFNAYDEKGNQIKEAIGENNCLALNIPANYKGKIEIKYETPFVWRISEVISLICVLSVIGKLIYNKLTTKKQYFSKNTLGFLKAIFCFK